MGTTYTVLAIIITVLLCIAFIIIINFGPKKGKLASLRFRNVSLQLLAMTIWVSILSNIFFPNHTLINNSRAGIAIFVISLVIGALLIRSMFRETEIENAVEDLLGRLHNNSIELKKLDIQKGEFVSLASHQLRGPLANAHGYTSMMIEGDYGEVPEHLKEPLNRIFQSTSFLGFLINDFLNVGKIDKGEMEYTIEDFDLSKFLAETIGTFSVSASAAHLDLISEFDAAGKVSVRADKNKTRQIISNLIDNAIKYTPKGYISFQLVASARYATIHIKDTGIGIGPKIKEKLFKKFMRDVNAVKVNVTGSGLGLYVASIMAKGMGGKIWAESAGEGQGTTFFIELPLSQD